MVTLKEVGCDVLLSKEISGALFLDYLEIFITEVGTPAILEHIFAI